jgi:hypothetical protein
MARSCDLCGTPSTRGRAGLVAPIAVPIAYRDGEAIYAPYGEERRVLACPPCRHHLLRYGVMPRDATDADRAAFDAAAGPVWTAERAEATRAACRAICRAAEAHAAREG